MRTSRRALFCCGILAKNSRLCFISIPDLKLNMAKPSGKPASKITMVGTPDENETLHHFTRFLHWLKEDKELEAKRQQIEELQEGIRQLEWAVLKLEAEEKGNLNSLNLQWHEKRLKAAALGDHEKELKEFTRQYHKLKNLESQLRQITEKGLFEKALLERIEFEIRTLAQDPSSRDELNALADEKRSEIQSLRGEYLVIEEQIQKLEPVLKQIAVLEIMMAEAKKAEHESRSLQEEIERIKGQLSKQTFAKREVSAMEDLKRQLQSVPYNASYHKELRRSIDRYLETELPAWLKESGLIS